MAAVAAGLVAAAERLEGLRRLTALFAAIAAVYLADGRLFGLFWVGLALAMLVATRYVYLRSRPGRLDSSDDRPD